MSKFDQEELHRYIGKDTVLQRKIMIEESKQDNINTYNIKG